MAMVFISYRRADSSGTAGRVHDRLAQEFSDSLVFMDVDNIPLGLDFVKVLRDAVSKCDVLLAVIGQHWLDAQNADGGRRLDSENDFVRIEITTALQRGISVIPILVDGAEIPKAVELPEDLKGLATRNGLDVRHGSFHVDMDRLISGLKAQIGGSAPWTATAEGGSIVIRKLNEMHVLNERYDDGLLCFQLWLDGNLASTSTAFKIFRRHYIFTIKDSKFEFIVEGMFKVKAIKLLANNAVIFEWNRGTAQTQANQSGGPAQANSR